jgi:glycosyltransferase involved in cell wall biosynthesis
MRIAYVYDAVYPWETGGVQKRVWELARRLADDHDVHWYGLKYWDGPTVIEREGVTLHGVDEAESLYVGERRSIGEALSFTANLTRPLLAEEFDVVDFQEFPYFPAFPSKLHSLTRDSALVLSWHEVWDDYWYEYLGWKGAFGKAVERAVARLPDRHVAVSEQTRRELQDIGVDDAQIVPNGIELDGIRDAHRADQEVDVLFVGRFIEQKNVDLIVHAVDQLRATGRDIRCTLLGEGPERDRIADLVDARGLSDHVSLLNPRDRYEDVLGLMKAADVFVLPSRREGFGITALESMACGTPVVTVDHPRNAAGELVSDGGSGVVTEPTASAVAGGIKMASNKLASEDCVEAARKYEWDRIATEMEAVYRELC